MMRMYQIMSHTAVLLIVFFSPVFSQAKEKNTNSRMPYVPRMQTMGNAVIAGIATAQAPDILSNVTASTTLMVTDSRPNYLFNHAKGDLGEAMMDRIFTSRLLQQNGGWQALTPASHGRNGIDGLYIKMSATGHPSGLMVADAKVNSARLGVTRTGKQMSHSWITPRLKDSAQRYHKIAEKFTSSSAKMQSSIKHPSKELLLQRNGVLVQINDKTSAWVWKDRWGNYNRYFSLSKDITPEQIGHQARLTGDYLMGAANGKINFRSNLFTYEAKNNMHIFKIKQLNAMGNVKAGSVQVIRGKFSDLPVEFQKAIRHATIQTIGRHKTAFGLPKYDKQTLTQMVKKCCENPQDFERLCVRSNALSSPARLAGTAGGVVAIIGTIDIVTQLVGQGEINWKQTATMTTLAGTSTAVGIVASRSMAVAGLSKVANFAGGSVAGVIMAGGMYLAGYGTLDEALVNAGFGVATSAAICATPVVMMAIAATIGTTAKGVAIYTLSGAAFTKAALAWWGGGAIAAGGAGIAGGTTTIMVATGGTAIVIMAIPIIYSTWKRIANESSQRLCIANSLETVEKRVRNNQQAEWILLQPVI